MSESIPQTYTKNYLIIFRRKRVTSDLKMEITFLGRFNFLSDSLLLVYSPSRSSDVVFTQQVFVHS